ncbi:MAG: META domain-containing protein [Candidatus Peribacteria bacterium]|jgi:heat shock protein HslJ|nr:META domain-containing protein [Candidatus Peribacteria bacterium]
MKKILLSMVTLSMTLSPVLAAVPAEGQQAFLEEYGITSTTGKEPITRANSAKLFINYLQKSEGAAAFAERANHTYQCGFTDISNLEGEIQEIIKNACSHGLFKGNSQKFRPNDNLTRAEMLAVLSRISNENIQETNPRWNEYYTTALNKGWLTTNDKAKMETNITQETLGKLLYTYDTSKPKSPTTDQGKTTNELANTTRELQLFDGKAVSGNYTLNFTDTTVHTKLCNNINGNYTVSGTTLNASLIQTEMACLDNDLMNLEQKFNLENANFAIASTKMTTRNLERLLITTKDGHSFTYSKQNTTVGGDKDKHGCIPSAGYTRNEAAQACQRPWEHENPLANTERTLTAYNGNKIQGNYTLSFTENIVHTQFCNIMKGPYSVSGSKITGSLASTKMLCSDKEKMTLEDNFSIENATFGIASTKMVDNNLEILTITTKDGKTYTRAKIWTPRE